MPVQCRPKRTRKSVPANGIFCKVDAYSVGVKQRTSPVFRKRVSCSIALSSCFSFKCLSVTILKRSTALHTSSVRSAEQIAVRIILTMAIIARFLPRRLLIRSRSSYAEFLPFLLGRGLSGTALSDRYFAHCRYLNVSMKALLPFRM